ncbi:S8 family serine peptidase [Actinosynnema sp. NPDC047251]|uniref:Peptidase S8/S53, subtilisin kexin sedolisin n=1 Tax=Saccharothrix espanaensis (strain ATCC 51144 / DSM 44229 / JCM 9112 / NBRC 15066 / NRRL 15764) TaxID=1179773 RepID=K0K7S8_SACES|nr:S8 family serine peptidase [Saccharothrix espanaensis]CCH34436.1 Peptidase S8/S53, subtilisin kexin sedolisin [Saccharothrix espanaensis DSM 44229]
MSRSRVVARSAVPVLAAILVAGSTAAPALAAEDQPAESVAAAHGLDAGKLQLKVGKRLTAAEGRVTAFVELEAKPAVDTYTEKTSQGATKQQAKDAAKATKNDTGKVVDSVVRDLKGKDAATKEVYRTGNGVVGVVVTADADKVREIAQRADVKSVRTVVPKSRQNSSAVQLTNTLKVWQQYGKLGDDTRIGIIDTGIDYTHADFGGPGTIPAFEAIDETKVDASYFPTAKVVGGYDFVGNGYDGESKDPAVNTPKPDPNPIDCNGHGSHVAGTSAGFGVNADGSTFKGDYTKLTGDSLNALRIGPGTAPKALLYALKVFGCEGSTNVTAQALDWSLDPDGDGDFSDHLDVVNLSLGSDYGAPDDPDSLFVRKLNASGVVTVFSAGNGGDLYDIGGAPGSTPESLTVASSRDAYVLRDAAEATAPAAVAGLKSGQYSQSYNYEGKSVTAPVVPLGDAGNKDGCQPLSAADAAAVKGKIAWLEWDDNDASRRCGSGARANNVTAAGAVGAIFSSTLENFSAGIAGNAAIPVIQLTGGATASVRPALTAGTLTVRLAGYLRTALPTYDQAITDTPSSFTSRGVRGPVVKPDVAAPGDSIASAAVGSGNKTAVLSGTSMAAPHTTGIAALVRQAHPDWTPEEVKAAIMNSASADVKADGKTYAPNRVGAGRIDGKAALDNQVLAYVQDDPGAVSASFGVVEVTRPVALSKTVKVVNKSTRWVDYTIDYEALTSIPGVKYELSQRTVRLSPRGIAKVKVTLKIDDPAALRKTVDPTVEATHLDVPRQFLADASGRIVFTPKSGSTVALRVPVYSAPKPAADINTPSNVTFKGNAKQSVLNLTGRGVNQGAYKSLVSVLELQQTSPKLRECRRNVTTNCTLNDTAKGGDLRYVGATSTAPLAKAQGEPQNALLAFGLVTWGNWYNLGNNTVPFVDIDTTGDGVPDFEVYANKLTDTDLLVAVTQDLRTGETVDIQAVNGQFGDVDTNVFDTNVVVLPVLLSSLDIDPNADTSRISYTSGVAGFYVAPGTKNGLIDSIGTPSSFDPLKPGLWVQGGGDAALSYVARPGTALVVNRDAAALTADKADSLLVLNHHNATGDKADVVKVKATRSNRSAD